MAEALDLGDALDTVVATLAAAFPTFKTVAAEDETRDDLFLRLVGIGGEGDFGRAGPREGRRNGVPPGPGLPRRESPEGVLRPEREASEQEEAGLGRGRNGPEPRQVVEARPQREEEEEEEQK